MNKELAVVWSTYNGKITSSMKDGAIQTLQEQGFANDSIHIVEVAGAFELPLACQLTLENRPNLSGCIAIGCVIKGETPHFDFVCAETARGLMNVGLKYSKPVIFGVLTTLDESQALRRSGWEDNESYYSDLAVKKRVSNKGHEAAQAFIQMLNLYP